MVEMDEMRDFVRDHRAAHLVGVPAALGPGRIQGGRAQAHGGVGLDGDALGAGLDEEQPGPDGVLRDGIEIAGEYAGDQLERRSGHGEAVGQPRPQLVGGPRVGGQEAVLLVGEVLAGF